MHRRASQPAWADEDDAEPKHPLHQNEAITAQMIGIISSRLQVLQTVANNRQYGLECDLKVNSDYCSKMVPYFWLPFQRRNDVYLAWMQVPGLQDPFDGRASTSNKPKAAAQTTSVNNQAMMERLFGPDDKTRLRAQVLKKNKAEMQKSENRRNARVQLEKQLVASIEGHITRTVESYTYSRGDVDVNSSPVHVNAKLLLLHTCERMRIAQGKKNFKRFLLSELSCGLFEEMFWLCFCHLFQKDSDALQHALVGEISGKYIKMVALLHATIDYVFKMYPYSVASAVCWGFHYLFPGSRHLYTTDLKNDVFLFVCQLLLGLKLSPVSVQIMRKQLFPDEAFDDIGGRGKASQNATIASSAASASTTALLPVELSAMAGSEASLLLPRLTSPSSCGSLHKSTSESYLGRQGLSDNTVEKILKGSVDDIDRPIIPRAHQQRAFFNASQLSPLMKEYFGSENKSAKKPCFVLRTTPFAGCPVGGEETYHKHFRRKPLKNHALEASREQDKCMRDVQAYQSDTRQSLAVLSEMRDKVLSSGKKGVQAYCTMIISKRKAQHADEGTAPAPSSSTELSALVAQLQQVARRLEDYEPMDSTWQEAEKVALAARDKLAAMLRTPDGVQQLRTSDALPLMKQLVPEAARDEIAELNVVDFVLGMMFVKPFTAFQQVYRGYGTEYAKELSQEARQSANIIKSSFVYGEISFFPFVDVLRWIAPQLPPNAVLYDLGAGIGKAVIAAALIHPFQRVIGIEALEPLVACADKRAASYNKLPNSARLCVDVDFQLGDFLQLPWADGDIVFCHGTCYSDAEWNGISLAAEQLKQGAFFVSASMVLHTALFEVVRSLQVKMSWGTCTFYIHRRRKIGRWAAQMLRGGRATRTDLMNKANDQNDSNKQGKASELRDP
ncbi:TPA: LOW QUALITY PROTEIN: hypothetical protein N0F65_004271 [Lagenidium giganteum]|uniref:Histone-lysine N-methyltransferase, H3 lysine-79 specific n=1 Tax=Lagenidium giganteum TaxID=4803 RepID=A0AAV2ZB08_9STRA|nr:TPA: LOW QUALITY PROTEIN: hypothetical protein N0F65_004271 [Lagenidium giganteum]